MGYSGLYYFSFDTVYPKINFTPPTLGNASTIAVAWIYVNVSVNGTGSNVTTFIDFDNSLVSWWRMDDINSSGDPQDYTGRNNGSAQGDAAQTDGGYFGKEVRKSL